LYLKEILDCDREIKALQIRRDDRSEKLEKVRTVIPEMIRSVVDCAYSSGIQVIHIQVVLLHVKLPAYRISQRICLKESEVSTIYSFSMDFNFHGFEKACELKFFEIVQELLARGRIRSEEILLWNEHFSTASVRLMSREQLRVMVSAGGGK